MLRWIVATTFLVVSVTMIWTAFVIGPNTGMGTLLVNMGTEVFGILITVAVVEWFFERRRLQDRARERAWSTLHALERAVWIWQGGPRRLGTEELLGLISGIRENHPIAAASRTLMVNLGTQCRDILDREAQALRSLPGLTPALEDLGSLRSLRDGDSSVSIRMVAEILESAATSLALVLGQSTQRIPAGLIRYRDASESAQMERSSDIVPTHTERPNAPAESTVAELGFGQS